MINKICYIKPLVQAFLEHECQLAENCPFICSYVLSLVLHWQKKKKKINLIELSKISQMHHNKNVSMDTCYTESIEKD